MRIASLLTASAICAGALSAPTAASAQVAVPGEPQISVYLRSIGSASRAGGWAGETKRFAVGDPFTLLLVSGNLAKGDTSICSIGGFSSSTLEELLQRYVHVWRIMVTPLDYSAGQQKLAHDWARFRTGSPDKSAAGETLEITLNGGDRHVLDFLHRDPSSRDCETRAVLLDVSAGFKEDAAFADAMLKYDLWLVHTDKRGEKITRTFVTMGRQGAEMSYGFPSFRFGIPNLSGVTRQYEVTMNVEGAIRGRFTADGKIVLELTTDRRDRLTESAETAGFYSERVRGDIGSGRKFLEVASGETIAIKIPSRSGHSAARSGDAPLSGGLNVGGRAWAGAQTDPVVVVNSSIRIDWKQFFEGHETSLVLKVTRVQ